MSNTYFQFKQFRIEQEKCAMKVCTDSCLFGAWIPVDDHVKTILDIGCGTGLLSLMLAQKSDAKTDAVEIDEDAFQQAKLNIENSIFAHKISVFNQDILNFNTKNKYDLVVCNPPFYENEMASQAANEKLAKHSTHLPLSSLLKKGKSLLQPDGKLAILLPYFRAHEFETEAAKNELYIEKKLSVKQTPKHDFFRVCYVVKQQPSHTFYSTSIIIKDEQNCYTAEFTDLLKPYYLHL